MNIQEYLKKKKEALRKQKDPIKYLSEKTTGIERELQNIVTGQEELAQLFAKIELVLADVEQAKQSLVPDIERFVIALFDSVQDTVQIGKDGKGGSDYILTEQDKQDIAKSVTIPTVEKVVEIIKEQPVYTTQIVEKTIETIDPQKIIEKIREELELFIKNEIRRLVRERRSGGGGSTSQVNDLIAAANLTNWIYLVSTWSTEPTLSASITGGDVYTYTLDGTTRYRFVPTVYNATQDAFYTTFIAGVLSGLIIARG